MCGISGIISTNKVNYFNLDLMSDSLNHRGPDFKANWFSEDYKIAFAHNRLSILDLSEKANQPMISKNKRYVISFNGEIYNFRMLKNHLDNIKVINWSSTSDTEVLLELISHYGIQKSLELVQLLE